MFAKLMRWTGVAAGRLQHTTLRLSPGEIQIVAAFAKGAIRIVGSERAIAQRIRFMDPPPEGASDDSAGARTARGHGGPSPAEHSSRPIPPHDAAFSA